MKRTVWKSAIALFVCALFVLTGCTATQQPASDGNEQILAQLNEIKQQLDDTKSELASIKQEGQSGTNAAQTAAPAPVDTTTPEPVIIETEVPENAVYGVGCTVNGGASVVLDGPTEVRAVADTIEGYEFDHWEFGEMLDYESGATATFIFDAPTVLHAVFHARRVVTFINCHMNFLNAKDKASGKDYKQFDFEDDYTNPETKQNCKGGEIDFFVTADVPKGKQVDYWLINGVKYDPNTNLQKFRVKGQTAATVYEVVFENVPATYYTVTCHNCTFSGGDYSGATSGKVKAGTQITVYGHSDSSACYFVGSPSSASHGSYSNPMSPYKTEPPKPGHTYSTFYFRYTYTVTSDTDISFYGIVN